MKKFKPEILDLSSNCDEKIRELAIIFILTDYRARLIHRYSLRTSFDRETIEYEIACEADIVFLRCCHKIERPRVLPIYKNWYLREFKYALIHFYRRLNRVNLPIRDIPFNSEMNQQDYLDAVTDTEKLPNIADIITEKRDSRRQAIRLIKITYQLYKYERITLRERKFIYCAICGYSQEEINKICKIDLNEQTLNKRKYVIAGMIKRSWDNPAYLTNRYGIANGKVYQRVPQYEQIKKNDR